VLILVISVAWFATGAIAVVVMRHRGHDAFAWAVVFLFLGPLALPVALSADRHRPTAPRAPTHEGRFDVLVAHDGSADAAAATEAALELIGAHLTSLTYAAVLDLEATSTVRGRSDHEQAQARLDALARDSAAVTSAPVDTVILFGEPIDALQRFAGEHGYELIVAGCHVAGRSRIAGRRAVWKLATQSPVPVLLGPVH
jgi:nucleotide-binding universal stress UspA family protein